MPALASDRNTVKLSDSGQGLTVPYIVQNGVQVFAGSIGAIDTAAGFLRPAAPGATFRVVGVIADKKLGNGVDKAKVERGAHWFSNATAADAVLLGDVGADCFAIDDQTVARVNTGSRPRAGRILQIDAVKGVLVEFN